MSSVTGKSSAHRTYFLNRGCSNKMGNSYESYPINSFENKYCVVCFLICFDYVKTHGEITKTPFNPVFVERGVVFWTLSTGNCHFKNKTCRISQKK